MIMSCAEVSRLTPFPFPIWKTCTESIELEDYDGRTVLIEKGTKITLPIRALHSHPDYYPNAEQFDPGRFDRSFDTAKKLKEAGVFMPFGNGPRSCLGMSLYCSRCQTGHFYHANFIVNYRNQICNRIDESSSVYLGEEFRVDNQSYRRQYKPSPRGSILLWKQSNG